MTQSSNSDLEGTEFFKIEESSDNDPSSTDLPSDDPSSNIDSNESAHEKHQTEAGAFQLKEKAHKQLYDKFLAELNNLSDPQEKLQHTIAFMELTLSTKNGTPHFKGFWESRNIALDLFKENVAPQIRAEFWAKYSDLSKEARRLKEMLDEQSAYASEQIEIAIDALEKEQENAEEVLKKISFDHFAENVKTIEKERDYFYQVQQELNMLNAQAGRITALRKELIRTEMRVRQKNKFFQRLSATGDKVFPRRKELIKEVSARFSSHVDRFIQEYFDEDEEFQDSLFFLREEIKALQSMAKQITLNTQSFTYTRMKLSECWDKLKNVDKERKKIRAQQKTLFKQNADQVFAQLKEIAEKIQSAEMTHAEAQAKLDEIADGLRRIELGKDELRAIREELSIVRKPMMDKLKAEEQERLHAIQERERLRKQKVLDLKADVDALLAGLESFDAEELNLKKDELLHRISDLSINKSEKQDLERFLKPVKDAIVDKKEKSLMSLSEDDRQAIQQLKEILKQRKERRTEIKNQLEIFRKGGASSGLDFEKAMSFNAQVALEKERFEKISLSIKEIESKIKELEAKI